MRVVRNVHICFMTNLPSSDICKQLLKVKRHQKALTRARQKARETWQRLLDGFGEDEKCVFTAGNWTEAGGNIRRVSRRSDLAPHRNPARD